MVELDSFFLVLGTSLISFVLGVFATRLENFLKKKAEKKKLNQKFIDFFNLLTQIVDNLQKSKLNILTLLYYMDKDTVSRKLESIFDIKYSPETTKKDNQTFIYISECIENARIRLEDDEWILFIGFFVFKIDYKLDRSKKMDLYESINESERVILLDFLRHLEEKFKKAKIIRKSKVLVDDTLIKKIKG
ncbi:hypothetical protein GF385_02875 [Candidatus Dependentiae bacterium]|nr:hypothetical protein [Candidatus Dependentiae bacterium]